MRITVAPAFMLSVALVSPAWADNDKGHGHGDAAAIAMAPGKAHRLVTEHDRVAVYSFYRTEYVSGRCPPGLARKENGCLPPGQARRAWALGMALPPTVTFYPLPGGLVAQLTLAPEGYQYVRIDNDIVLMALGTRLVVEPVGSIDNLREDARPLVTDHDRGAVTVYYRDDYLAGNCPAGLVRTDQGCQPKRLWALEQPLDPAVAYEELPQPLLAQLDPVPDGYTYIRLGEQILLMAVETRIIRALVVDLSHLPPAPAAVTVSGPGVVLVPERVESGGGGCPPGLAKKHNGCLPPGHAK